MKRKILGMLLTTFLVVNLSACGSTTIASVDTDTLQLLKKNNLTSETITEIDSALAEKERRANLIDVDDLYQEDYFNYSKEFSDAYTYTLIDADGNKLNDISNVDINSLSGYVTDKFSSYEELANYLRTNVTTKEALIDWIRNERWFMDVPEVDSTHKYPAILYVDFTINGDTISFAENDLDLITYDGLILWLNYIYDAENEQVEAHKKDLKVRLNSEVHRLNLIPEGVDSFALTEQDLLNYYLNYLNTKEFTVDKTATSDFIVTDEITGRKVLTSESIEKAKSEGKVLGNLLKLTIYGNVHDIDTDIVSTQLSQVDVINALENPISLKLDSTTYGEKDNGDGVKTKVEIKVYAVEYNIDGVTKSIRLVEDVNTGKLKISKYDIYKFLGIDYYT